jgi:hypothetical protein
MLPNDGASLSLVFGESYTRLHNLTASEIGTVDVLSQVRNFNQPLSDQIRSMQKQLQCLERIQAMELPNYEQLEQLARIHRTATLPYARFQMAFKSMWSYIHVNRPSEEIRALGQLFKDLGTWIELQEEFSSEECPNVINGVVSGPQTTEILDQISSIILREKVQLQYKDTVLKTSEIPTIPTNLLHNYASFSVVAKLMFDPTTEEKDIRTIYASYANLILKRKGVQYAESMLRQDLNSFFELASTYFVHELTLSTKLLALTDNVRFEENRNSAIALFEIFAALIPYVGVPTTLTLRSCFFGADIDNFESSHKFIQMTKQPAKEAFWPLAWLGLENTVQLSAEDREKLLAGIPNPDAKLWVERAFVSDTRNVPQNLTNINNEL